MGRGAWAPSAAALAVFLTCALAEEAGEALSEDTARWPYDDDMVLRREYYDYKLADEARDLDGEVADKMAEADIKHMVDDGHLDHVERVTKEEVLQEIVERFEEMIHHVKILDERILDQNRFLKKELASAVSRTGKVEQRIGISIGDLRNDLGPRIVDAEEQLRGDVNVELESRALLEGDFHVNVARKATAWNLPVIVLALILAVVGVSFYLLHMHLSALQQRRYRHLRRS